MHAATYADVHARPALGNAQHVLSTLRHLKQWRPTDGGDGDHGDGMRRGVGQCEQALVHDAHDGVEKRAAHQAAQAHPATGGGTCGGVCEHVRGRPQAQADEDDEQARELQGGERAPQDKDRHERGEALTEAGKEDGAERGAHGVETCCERVMLSAASSGGAPLTNRP